MNKPAFQPEPRPRVLKSNINKITQYVTKRITAYGYDVYISYSDKSRSRYLEIKLSEERKIIVRISDHIANKENRWRCNFDIHTNTQRRGSLDYVEFLDAFKSIVGEKRPSAENIEPGSSPGKEQL